MSGVVLRCFACNSSYRIIFKCPHASQAQRVFLGDIVVAAKQIYNSNISSLFFNNYDGSDIPCLSEDQLDAICELALGGAGGDTVIIITYQLEKIVPGLDHGPAPTINLY